MSETYKTHVRSVQGNGLDVILEESYDAEDLAAHLNALARRVAELEAERAPLRAERDRLAAVVAECVTGIEWWARQEDGVPEEVWGAYCAARSATDAALREMEGTR